MNHDVARSDDGRKTVLIVEDDPGTQRVLASGLATSLGMFEVLTADHGQEAVELLETRSIDVVVTDLAMPVMDGFALIGYLTNRATTPPVVVLSALAPTTVAAGLDGYGGLTVLRKPAGYPEVARAVIEALERHELGQVAGIPLASVLQLVEAERRTCSLGVTSGRRRGRLHFESGRLINAFSEDFGAEGEAAAFDILAWERTSISFERLPEGVRRTIDVPTQQLLIEVARRQDALREREAALAGNGLNGGGAHASGRWTAVEPASSEPTAPEPTASEPTASEPTASEPTASEPTAPEPQPSEPSAFVASASAPPALEPPASETQAAQPPESEPAASVGTEWHELGAPPAIDPMGEAPEVATARFDAVDPVDTGHGTDASTDPERGAAPEDLAAVFDADDRAEGALQPDGDAPTAATSDVARVAPTDAAPGTPHEAPPDARHDASDDARHDAQSDGAAVVASTESADPAHDAATPEPSPAPTPAPHADLVAAIERLTHRVLDADAALAAVADEVDAFRAAQHRYDDAVRRQDERRRAVEDARRDVADLARQILARLDGLFDAFDEPDAAAAPFPPTEPASTSNP